MRAIEWLILIRQFSSKVLRLVITVMCKVFLVLKAPNVNE